MTDIHIPFNTWSRERLTKNEKTATTRTKKYGSPGDQFEVNETVYELTHINKLNLEQVAQDWYEQEGAESPSEFITVWKNIHYQKGFEPTRRVWLHLFREVE